MNLYKWTDETRLQLAGVFYDIDERVAVASDGTAMLISKSDYVAPTADVKMNATTTAHGYLRMRTGACIVDKRFPDYKKVLDVVRETESTKFAHDIDSLRKTLADVQAYNRTCTKANGLQKQIFVDLDADVRIVVKNLVRITTLPDTLTWVCLRPKQFPAPLLFGENDNYKVVILCATK